ncbi:MAG: CapA family protein, partial [Gammaproteobacteria bacterium]
IDVVHGHSSHHPKAVEVYNGKPIIYGCGDFINDYEGIVGYQRFRGDLGLMYFVTVNAATGQLTELSMVPTQMKRFRVHRANNEDARWLKRMLNREGEQFSNRTQLGADNTLHLDWTAPA